MKASLLADAVQQLLSFFLLSLLDFLFFYWDFSWGLRAHVGRVVQSTEKKKKKKFQSRYKISIKIHKSLEGKTSLVQEMKDAKTKT